MERASSVYDQIIEHVFLCHYRPGDRTVVFARDELADAAHELGLARPRNLGDLIYTYRFRRALPRSIAAHAPPGHTWIIRLVGSARYQFYATTQPFIVPREHMAEIKIPDATPGVIARYAMSDEQALLAKLRYNRLLDIFTGVTCYSLQSHLRTQVPDIGQTETDEIYVGIDKRGAHYVFPVQAKGGRDRLSLVQIEQDLAVCLVKFPGLICRPIAAQFVGADLIALFAFDQNADGAAQISEERHYRLVAAEQLSAEELLRYRQSEAV